MHKKFYTFRAGQRVPLWMLGVRANNRAGEFSKGYIEFSKSCVCVRVANKQTLVMPSTNSSKGDCCFYVHSIHDVNIGAENGASGVFYVPEDSLEDAARLYEEYINDNKS